MNWLLEGLKRRVDRGHLDEPSAVSDLRAATRDKKGTAQEFVALHVQKASGKKITASDLYKTYKAFCAANGTDVLPDKRLKHCMETAGYEQRKISSMKWIDVKSTYPANDNKGTGSP